jgi:hypothetical protein
LSYCSFSWVEGYTVFFAETLLCKATPKVGLLGRHE